MAEMGEPNRTGDAALVRAVRLLDQGDAEAVPDRLERVWNALEDYCRGSPHSAEMLLRWLLKNMAGSTANAERVRRYPRVWDILGAVFALVPTISLAKSLADRRFVGILQQTLREIAVPQEGEVAEINGTDPDVDMADAPPRESPVNPRKRKRTDPASFDLNIQIQVAGCLQTAEAVFDALRVLLSRCERESFAGPVTHRMGAEHVKSLFAVSAAEAMAILVPWLAICALALDKNQTGASRQQSSWVTTWSALWALHRQSAADASEVATHLSGVASRLLGKLTGTSRQTHAGIDVAVRDQWAQELCLFLSRNLILPARAFFLTKGSKEVVQIAVDMSSASAHITYPVLFDLVSKSPLEFGGQTPRKEYETWIQTVFDAIVHALKNINRESRQLVIRAIMEMAAERSTSLSASSLRAVCRDYAIGKNSYDWSLLLSIMTLNPDVFLVTEEGNRLLEQVLEKTRESDSFDAADSEKAARFIVRLADGYAQARDLSTFVKVWLKHLAPIKAKAGLPLLWAQKELAETVAKLIQTSLNSNQLVDVLEWLSSQTQPTEGIAKIHILEVVSSGISQEEFVDAANMKTFEGTLSEKYSKKDHPAVSACRWMVAAKAISRGTLDEAGQIWSQVRSDIKSVLRKSPLDQEDTFAAFRCCVAAWLANHPGGAYEDDAATLICLFVERLEDDGDSMELDSSDGETSVRKGTYVSWILSDAPRVLSLLVEKKGRIPKAVLSLLTMLGSEHDARFEPVLATFRLLLNRETNLDDQKLMDTLVDTMVSKIDTSKAARSDSQTIAALRFLLAAPAEVLSRTQREAAMGSLVSHLPGGSDNPHSDSIEHWTAVLSLMVKLMGRPTFYEGMSFSHVESIGRCLGKVHNRSNRRSREVIPADNGSGNRSVFKPLQQLAMLFIRQMASSNPEEREKAYLKEAISLLQSPCQDSEVVPRIVLLQAYISTLKISPALKSLVADGLDLDSLENHLLQLTVPIIESKERHSNSFPALLVVLGALSDLDRGAVRQALADFVPRLLEMSDSLLETGVKAGWEIRMFVANYFPEALTSPLKVKMSVESSAAAEEEDKPVSSEPAATLGKSALLRYVDAVVRSADEETKLDYLQELLPEDSDGQDVLGRLLVIYRLIQHLKGSSRPLDTPDRFDLARAHGLLCDRLLRTTAPAPFLLTSKAIHLLLDQNPASMTQWNIEHTLCTVSAISLQPSTQALVADSPGVYPSLCRLVEMVIRRHRKRLDGHFHALTTPLQSLLRLLLSRPHTHHAATVTISTSSSSSPDQKTAPQWVKHAKLFSRLLTLVCEPTAASVSSSRQQHSHSHANGTGPLDSERDRAKRYAGQYMHRVVAEYVRLQLGHAVPHGVREALEPGVYSVLDITGPEALRAVNNAMDASGSVIFKDMYRMYQRFGKWSGV